jgi:hypothetical protein
MCLALVIIDPSVVWISFIDLLRFTLRLTHFCRSSKLERLTHQLFISNRAKITK